jgi:hypothetical protein
MKKYIRASGAAALLPVLAAAALVVVSPASRSQARRPQTQAPAARPGAAQVGDMKFDVTFGTASLDATRRDRYILKLSGNNGSAVPITTPRYDMSAQHIQAILLRTNTAARYKATEITANGRVRVIAREPEAKRTTTVTCDRAVYTATTDPKDRGRIQLTGNVRTVTEDPGLPKPLVSVSKTGVIIFPPEGGFKVDMGEGNMSATVNVPSEGGTQQQQGEDR